jgi:hypothetical protein
MTSGGAVFMYAADSRQGVLPWFIRWSINCDSRGANSGED